MERKSSKCGAGTASTISSWDWEGREGQVWHTPTIFAEKFVCRRQEQHEETFIIQLAKLCSELLLLSCVTCVAVGWERGGGHKKACSFFILRDNIMFIFIYGGDSHPPRIL